MVVAIGAVFTMVGVKSVLLCESEDIETSLVKTGSAAVESVVGLKDSVMEYNIGAVVVDVISVMLTNGLVVEHDAEQEEELYVEGMGAIETDLLVVEDEWS